MKRRVLVVDDSPFVCKLMCGYLAETGEADVVGTAHSGGAAIEMAGALRPDVITLDLEMPGMNGLETLREIMQRFPTPVVVVSGVSRRAALAVENAFQLGAVDFVFKYVSGSALDPAQISAEVRSKVLAAARVRVVRALPADALQYDNATRLRHPAGKRESSSHAPSGRRATHVVVIGASTGGMVALQKLLESLPEAFPAGIVVVQHVPASFTGVVASQLARTLRLPVREAANGDTLMCGTVLVAPGGFHLQMDSNMRIRLDQSPEVRGHRPSIDIAMHSVALACGRNARGVLLTGMGDDGCAGLEAIQARGGGTLAQLPESCVAGGMPSRAIEKGVVDHIGTPEAIGLWLKYDLARPVPAASSWRPCKSSQLLAHRN